MRNRKSRYTAFLLLLLLLNVACVFAQEPVAVPRSQQAEDSLIALLSPQEYDSILNEIDDLLSFIDKKEVSYTDISITAGNGIVALRNSDLLSTNYRTVNRLLISLRPGISTKVVSGCNGQVILPCRKAS